MKADQTLIDILTCPVCFKTVAADTTTCPICGYPFEEGRSRGNKDADAEQIVCAVCLKVLPADTEVCPICGSSSLQIDEDILADTVWSDDGTGPNAPKDRVIAKLSCSVCLRTVPDDSEVCPTCGFPLADLRKQHNERVKPMQEIVCPVCLKSLPADTDICPTCGFPFADVDIRAGA